jgi:hypothetical protein
VYSKVVTERKAITGTFSKDPRVDEHGPMLLLVSKEGIVSVVENSVESSGAIVILDSVGKMCLNMEHGVQCIAIHPDFIENRYVSFY